jgi:hypothetical protein
MLKMSWKTFCSGSGDRVEIPSNHSDLTNDRSRRNAFVFFRSNELPRTVEVTKEYLNALRRAVGQLIDPETAEVNWWHVEMVDPYGDYTELPPHSQCTGRAYFARAPGIDVWIESADLPEATVKRLREIHNSRPGQTAAK